MGRNAVVESPGYSDLCDEKRDSKKRRYEEEAKHYQNAIMRVLNTLKRTKKD